ncbi:uncharacterized protein LOC135127699 isoform X2 [Zophobas morio]
MFTLPPLPPKDYVLKDVNQNQRSVQEFTPIALPRITQSNLLKYCAPIDYQENEKLSDLKIDHSVNPQLLERWTDNVRAYWVDKPGKNDYFLHDIFKKYSVEVVPSYDDRFKHNERVFYRSFIYELDCMEDERLKKLYKKMDREEKEELEKYKIIEEKNTKNLDGSPCKSEIPFWWRQEVGEEVGEDVAPKTKGVEVKYDYTGMRWQEEPSLTEYAKMGPCKRRGEMALVGKPFRSEACNWYYSHYPPPNIRFVHKRFT